MNRLQTLDAIGLDAPSYPLEWRIGDDRVGCETETSQRGLSCSLFAPMHYERGYAYPLVVWLHGDGGDEQQLRRVMPHVSVRNYVAVAPRGMSFEEGRCGWPDSTDAAEYAAEKLHACIEATQRRYHVHVQRIFIVGYQSGGTMALRLGLSYPESFAGVVSIDGPMPRGGAPLRKINEARSLPLLLATCRQSEQYCASHVASDLRLLHSAGFSLALRQYPCDDGLTTTMLADVDRWMMERVCGRSTASVQ